MARRDGRQRAKSAPDPHAVRIRKLRAAMAAHPAGCDHVLITNPTDVGYLTGFLGGDSFLLVGPTGKPVVISDRRYEEDLQAFRSLVRVKMRDRSIFDSAVELMVGLKSEGKLGRVGLQPEDISLAKLSAFKAAAKRAKLGARVFTEAPGLVAGLRAIKDDTEVAIIRKAIRIQQAALEAVMPTITPGLTELEVCARLEYEMKSRGSTGPAFDTIVAAAANSSRPHYHPGKPKTRRNQVLLIDFGATVDGYRSDMTRVLALGRWPRELREVYGVVLRAHRAAARALEPGALCADIDAIARDVIARAGYGDKFGQSLGHGLGMDVHEQPSLAQRAGPRDVLEVGHVVTIEPGIYLPGLGGIRLEDDYLVTADGAKNLCSLTMDIEHFTL